MTFSILVQDWSAPTDMPVRKLRHWFCGGERPRLYSEVPDHERSRDTRLALWPRWSRDNRELAVLLLEENLDHRRELHAGADEHPPKSKIDL